MRSLPLTLLTFLLPTTVFAASIFPDVPASHPFVHEIESLYKSGVVKGNPNGTFDPNRSVNRAELLKLLYTASGKTPMTPSKACFSDVPTSAWFASYVCDAASREKSYVQGYNDGSFKPGNAVTRTEALKMAFKVLGLTAPSITSGDQNVIKFVDLSVTAWYSQYVSAAFRVGILPIQSIGGSRFYPEQALTRGEAAAIIVNALRASSTVTTSSSSSSSNAAVSLSASSASSEAVTMPILTIPSGITSTFIGKTPAAYTFTLSKQTTLKIDVGTTGTSGSSITCRLYLFDDQNFSEEYYLGMQTENNCRLLVTARPGRYQLQVQPRVADVPYYINASEAPSDKNDGFVEARTLTLGTDTDGKLESGDLVDWYTFTVSGTRKGTIFLPTGSSTTSCIVYALKDVDLFGFSAPQCGLEYTYPSGTYVIGVGRKTGSDIAEEVPFTVRWK